MLLGLAACAAVGDRCARTSSDIQEAVRTSLEDVRRIALELRPEALDDLGLMSALAVLCERFAAALGARRQPAARRAAAELSPRGAGRLPRGPGGADQRRAALRRRARRTAAGARRRRAGDDGSDHGRGLRAGGEPGTGIRGMRERAALIGATLDVGPNEDGAGARSRCSLRPSPPRRMHDPPEDEDPAGRRPRARPPRAQAGPRRRARSGGRGRGR